MKKEREGERGVKKDIERGGGGDEEKERDREREKTEKEREGYLAVIGKAVTFILKVCVGGGGGILILAVME